MDTQKVSSASELWEACQKIESSDLLVITNNHALSQDSSLAILFAMKQKRPIIMHNVPQFTQAYPFVKEAILKRLNKLVIANIETLDDADADLIMKTTGSSEVNYTITRHEMLLSRSYLLSRLKQAKIANGLFPYPQSIARAQLPL